jgi:hypothetical protein
MNIENNNPSTYCCVFVCNKAYFYKFIYTCNLLVTKGNYKGDICLIIGNDLQNDPLLNSDFISTNHIKVIYFPELNIDQNFIKTQRNLKREYHWFGKLFQYHKLYLFHSFFKQWNYIFYIDCGITIFSDITPILNEVKPNVLFAHSDSYPLYDRKLKSQFDNTHPQFFKLQLLYNLSVDYFQTTIMLYDTNIIENNTFDDLYKLMLEFPISITNDQGIISLYFTNVKPHFQQITIKNETTYFYDYLSRDNKLPYIMLKFIPDLST